MLIAGHSTSISLEDLFWTALGEVADLEGCSAAVLVARIDRDRRDGNLSSAIRVYLLERYRTAALGARSLSANSLQLEKASGLAGAEPRSDSI